MQTDEASSAADRLNRPPDDEADALVRAFLIADVRGYTSFTQARGDEPAAHLAATFAALAREAVAGTGGELVELRGDEALCVFPSARQALRAAVAMQVRFRGRADGEPVLPLGVGIGVAAGEAVRVEGGYRGGALNLAARLCSLATGGQILASDTVTSLAGTLEGVRFVERRRVKVKGFAAPVRVVEVVPELELPPVPQPALPRPRARRLLVLAASAVVAAAIAAVALVLALQGGASPIVAVEKGALVVLDSRSGVPLSAVRVGKAPSAVAVGPSGVWVVNGHDGTVSRVDPVRRTLTDTIGVGEAATDVAVTESDVWVSTIEPPTVVRIDARLSSVGDRIPVAVRGVGRARLAAGAGSIWVARDLVSLERVSPGAARVTARFPLKASGGGIAVGLGAVWVPTLFPRGLVRVPLDGSRSHRLSSRGVVADVAVAGGAVWLAIPQEDRVARLDPQRMAITDSLRVDAPSALASGRGAVWVASRAGKILSRIDVRSRRVARTVHLTAPPLDLALGAGALWIVSGR